MLSFYDADAAKEPGGDVGIRYSNEVRRFDTFGFHFRRLHVRRALARTVDGTVVAGDTEVPVADVRVRASRFKHDVSIPIFSSSVVK